MKSLNLKIMIVSNTKEEFQEVKNGGSLEMKWVETLIKLKMS